MKTTSTILAVLMTAVSFAQTVPDSLQTNPQKQQNAAQRILSGNVSSGVTVGGYGEIIYNQPEGDNGTLDVRRMIVLFGYKFNDRVQFVTELEFEHVKEFYVEQAFLQYRLNEHINLRGGLMLVPMGIVNEYHEPTTFNGVDRPSVDKSIVPSTWREIGIGIAGRFNEISLGYQAYVFNGFKSVNSDGNGNVTAGLLGGSNGLRGGRQKGAESTINKPNFSTKLDYYGLPGLRLGLAGYFGRTQAGDDVDAITGADVGITMVGFDARYAYKRFTARGQFINASISDSEAYNSLNGTNLGSKLQGWYVEGAFNLLPLQKEQQLFAFARYEDYNTHARVAGSLVKNNTYDRTDWTLGLSYKIAPGAVVKADYQIKDNASSITVPNQLNFGIGVWF